MADGGLTLTLTFDEATGSRLKAAADAAGVAVAEYVRGQLEDSLEDDRAEEKRRLAEYERTGVAIDLEDALTMFDRELDTALAAKAAESQRR